jgi:iron complex outermembrane recepter protein
MKTRIISMLGVAMLFATGVVKAQNVVHGKVTDEEGNPLTGAAVTIVNTYKGVFSGIEGNYKMEKVSNGKHQIRASFLGFEPDTLTVELDNEDVELNFKLNRSAFLTEEVVISSTRAGEKTPTTFTNLTKKEIKESNFALDLPFLMEFTPSAVVTSDAGGGVGYTGIRIRGSDQSRINVTVNGIPINDAESHGVFWVNMPDFASSVDNIQIQRGVGTSTNGAAAFGASVNVQTDRLIEKPYAEVSNAFGSFNTMRNTVKAGTGLINNKFTVDARLSRINSDGFIDRASSDLRSFYLSGAYHGKKDVLRVNVFSGKERTYQAWYGTPESRIKNDEQGMLDYAARNWLSPSQTENLLNSGRSYNFYEYENEVDNYQQDHYQVHYTRELSPYLTFNKSLHYTRGRGYFEQFRQNDRYSTYGYEPHTFGGSEVTFSDPFLVSNGDTIINPNPGMDTTVTVGQQVVNRTDLVRRRWLDNHFYGVVGSLNYNNRKGLDITGGWGWNFYDGDHFGEVIWANVAPEGMIGDRYYDNNATKSDYHAFVKTSYQVTNKLNAFVDLQFRAIDYTFEGLAVVNEEVLVTDQNVTFNFFNPKAGLYYDINSRSALYASYSVANREPVRRDFTESTPDSRPTHETLNNIEAGYRFRSKRVMFNANYYLMSYQNQLVMTGQVNDVGGFTRTNIDDSYRTGIEVEGGYRISEKFQFGGNIAFSQNKIKEFNEYIDNYDTGVQEVITHTNTDIAFSPNLIAAANLTYMPIKGMDISLIPKYVGEQFLDNTSDKNRMLDEYLITNLRINYTFKTRCFERITVGVLIYNMLDYSFESNGYTFSYIAGGERITENFYYPQAGRNFLFNLTVSF